MKFFYKMNSYVMLLNSIKKKKKICISKIILWFSFECKMLTENEIIIHRNYRIEYLSYDLYIAFSVKNKIIYI